MREKCEVWYIKRTENDILVLEKEENECPLSVIPIIDQIFHDPPIRAIRVPANADDIDIARNALTEEGWHFEDRENTILILRSETTESERKEISNFVQSAETEISNFVQSAETKNGGDKVDPKGIVTNLARIKGVSFAAILDDMGIELASAGDPGRGVKKEKLLTQTLMIYSTSAESGKNLDKGAVNEIVVMWEQGVCIVKALEKGNTLHVITSIEALPQVRQEIKDMCG